MMYVKDTVLCDGAENHPDFWRWDPEIGEYRIIDTYGKFFPLELCDSASEQHLRANFPGLRVATEAEIMWRAVHLLFEALMRAGVEL